MNDLNSYSSPALQFKVGSEECKLWTSFAVSIRKSQSWNSDWFSTARRFFLYGGAKPFNPKWDEVDRIVDYATALEATLVPDGDYIKRRMSHRAAALIAPDDPAEIVAFMKKFYEIRSRIAHGSTLGDESRQWLLDNCDQVEERVRLVLLTAVQKLPRGEEDRKVALTELYDLTDEDRGNSVFEKFRQIKTPKVRETIAAKIARLAEE